MNSKYYIFLTSGIFEMGGAEMFTANKCKYLKSKGWNVRVFYFRKFGKIKIQELACYENNYIPELLFGITYFTKKRRNEIVSQICNGISDGDEVIIESHIINLAYWGELVAKKTNGKSIVNAMEENIMPFTDNEASFIEFKVKRMEILNASVKSFHKYFNRRYKDEYANYTHNYMRAYCSNVTCDDDDSINLPNEGFNIMCIGRLDKSYVIPMFDEVMKFVLSNKDKKYNLLVIGDSPDGKAKAGISDMFKNIGNVKLYLYGYVFPVPRNLINKADVGIAMANSILVTSDQGIPTIAIDIHDLQPMGIYGRTTNNKFSRDTEPIVSVSTLLHEVLNDGKYPKIAPKEADVDAEMENVFGKQVDFLDLSPKDDIYYDVENVYPWYMYVKCQTKYMIHKIIGK